MLQLLLVREGLGACIGAGRSFGAMPKADSVEGLAHPCSPQRPYPFLQLRRKENIEVSAHPIQTPIYHHFRRPPFLSPPLPIAPITEHSTPLLPLSPPTKLESRSPAC